jgi:carbon storage regulator CsrA
MLVLSRRVGEKVFFPDICAYVKVLSVKGGTVRLSIDAPAEVLILREELRDRSGVKPEPRVDASSSTIAGD